MRPLTLLVLAACADSGTTEASGLADEVAALTATIDDLTDRLEAAEDRIAELEGRPDDTDAPDVGPWPARGTIAGTVGATECGQWLAENGDDPSGYFIAVPGLLPPGPPAVVWEERLSGWVRLNDTVSWSCVDDECGYEITCHVNSIRHLVIN